MNLKTDLMQKAQNVVTNKIIIIFLLLGFISFYSFSQKKEIKAERDYIILNKSLEHYFYGKHIRDSLFYNSETTKKYIESKEVKRAIIKRGKLDTIYIKYIADKVLYKMFLEENAKWKREKRYKKFSNDLEIIFSDDEVKYYLNQLESNHYLWNEDKIDFKDRVFVVKKFNYTREEAKLMGIVEKDQLGRTLIQRTNRYFTFSKPIYSKNNNTALIAYSYNANFILYIYEKVNKKWVFKLVLSKSYFI